jgi:hypothetical protein
MFIANNVGAWGTQNYFVSDLRDNAAQTFTKTVSYFFECPTGLSGAPLRFGPGAHDERVGC